ncbi:MAG: glycosyltransferase family 1 protein, partial [Vicinamibacterales bacterium]
MTPLRIGFDGRALTSPAAGVRRYTRELVNALIALSEPLELVMLGGEPTALPAGVSYVPESRHPPTNAGWMLVGIPSAMRRGRVDLLHAPAYTAPFWSPAPVVLTIHDVSYARKPEWFPYRRDALRRAFYRHSALRATRIITDSQFSADEIHAAYGIARRALRVVPLGVDASFELQPAQEVPLPSGVSAPFLLHVGDLHERRNLPMAVTAVLAARQRAPELAALSLVLAGVDRGVGPGLQALASEAGAADAVVLLGRVDERSLRALYQQAIGLLYPSFYEGFGLPVLEAMACGTPVIGAKAASIPEVLGSAGILVEPRSLPDWIEAIVRV